MVNAAVAAWNGSTTANHLFTPPDYRTSDGVRHT